MHALRAIEVKKVDSLTFAVTYSPWRVISLTSEKDALAFASELRTRLEAKPFPDWEIGYVMRIRDEIQKQFKYPLPFHIGD